MEEINVKKSLISEMDHCLCCIQSIGIYVQRRLKWPWGCSLRRALWSNWTTVSVKLRASRYAVLFMRCLTAFIPSLWVR